MARRKRMRNDPRNEYEFELLDEEEAEGLNSGGAVGEKAFKKGRKTRGGELYDAFAGGSDDDDDFNDAEYRDRSPMGEVHNEKRRSLDDEDDHHVIGDDSGDEEPDDPIRDQQGSGLLGGRR